MVSSEGAKISVDLSYDKVFIHPYQLNGPPSMLHGTVSLHLPFAPTIKACYVRLSGVCTMPGDKASRLSKEDKPTMELTEILIPPCEYTIWPAGDYNFEFTFSIPSDTEIAQNCGHAYVRHTVQAVVEFGAKATGFFASKPVAVKTEPRRVWIIALLNDSGDTPEPLNLSVEHFSHFLGPLRMEFLSPHLTIGALAHLRVHVVDPPQQVAILSIKSYLTQDYQISYSSLPSDQPFRIPLRHLDLSSVDDSGAIPTIVSRAKRRVELSAGQPWSYTELVRVPTCYGDIAASTFGPDRTIVVRHKLIVEIRYALPVEKVEKIMKIEKSVELASCVALPDSTLLPPYSLKAPTTGIRETPGSGTLCLCDYSLPEVVGFWGDKLKELPSVAPAGLEGTVTIKDSRVDA